MPVLKTILVVDDSAVNRSILANLLADEYGVLQAENGQVALALLSAHTDEIAAVILDLVMPVMDGYAFLEAIGRDARYHNLPIIVTTGNRDSGSEVKALTLGAWDFVSKPYHPQIISFRLKNAIDRSQLTALKRLKYLAEYDALTGIYNKTKFFDATREMIDANRQERFVFFRFDVDRFQLINSFFGTAEGDHLLLYIAEHLQTDMQACQPATCGRIESDIFGFCTPYDPHTVDGLIKRSKRALEKYNPNYDIVPSVGIYLIDDNAISVEEMYNRATLAAKICKGNYVDYYAYYNENMSIALTREQEIANEMNFALESGQFEIYFQPQYNIHTNLPCSAEALVRWNHPQKGMLSPSEFIPVFERNGFITKLDYYVWEQVCQYLRAWSAQGLHPCPLSVNVSRVNVYDPNLAETLLALVQRYQLAPALLNLELTESAYTDNPTAMKKTMSQLQSYGFTIIMDDFGSGYSSLSLLKDIAIDVLKIDMRFLSKTELPGRGENIIASVIRMAKWLNIPVIAEGAETGEQVDFLRSVGCDYVQGYYFARPMPVQAYEQLCRSQAFEPAQIADHPYENYRYDDLFSLNPEMKPLFDDALQAAAIYEFSDDQVEMIRVNEAYYALLGHDDMLARMSNVLSLAHEEYRAALLNAFRTCVKTQGTAECEYMRSRTSGGSVWIYTKLRYVSTAGNKHILTGELTDITMRKAIDSELQKYRTSLLASRHDISTALLVDDSAPNRAALEEILQDKIHLLEAESGEAAISILQAHCTQIDLILLNITLPKMDGAAFLRYKKSLPELDGIPVVMITADNSPEQQIRTLELGATDYIVRPFIPEVVLRRIDHVLESNRRFKAMIKQYNNMSVQVKTDLMTGLLNRVSAEVMITQRLETAAGTCAMLMLDIDNFKKLNDTRGHAYGDRVITAVARKLRAFFRQEDIVARMGGDEFAILLTDVPDLALCELKAHALCDGMHEIELDGRNALITCSVGIALSSEQTHSFEALYQNADKALYSAKCHGRNTVLVYGAGGADRSISKWITDSEGVLNAINDSIYACDCDTYEMLYANENLCKFTGVTSAACKGKKCYEILMRGSAPCAFCPLPKITGDRVYTRLFRPPNTDHVFLMRGKNIRWNDANVHLEVAVDVTEIEAIGPYSEEIPVGDFINGVDSIRTAQAQQREVDGAENGPQA